MRWTCAILLAAATSLRAAFVCESATELHTTADFDGDGRLDVVIVDKSTGNYRLAHQLAPGVHTWAAARASGVEPVTGLAAGRLLSPARDALAFTSPEANRLNLVDAASPTVAGQPVSIFIPSIGPNLAIAIDIGGGGNTAFDDLFAASRLNGMSPHRLTMVRDMDGASFMTLGEAAASSLAERGNRLLLKTGGPTIAGLLLRGGTDTFRGYRLDGGMLVQALELPGLAAGSDYVQEHFGGPGLSQFLFYKSGQAQLRLYPVTEPMAGTFEFGLGGTFTLPQSILQVISLPGASSVRLLVLFGAGESATVFNFDGSNAPVSLQNFAAPPGELLTGAAALADNGFLLLSGAEGRSTRYQTLNFDGASYTNGATGMLPAINPLSLGANVLQFQFEPFVAASPNLLRLQNAGEWSAGFQFIGGVPDVSATVESFLGPVQGLGNPTVTAFGPAHPSADFGLVNQFAPAISLYSFSAPAGDEVSEVRIVPAPGAYATRINISFTTANAMHEVYYRLNNSGAWTLYTAPIANVFTNTTVAYYAKPAAGDAKSIIRTAAYVFTQAPATLDSDNDGVPDYVEIANGLDALASGTDGDADGFSDFEELMSGTDPADGMDHPSGSPGQEQRIGFDLLVTPRPFDGVNGLTSLAVTGALCRAYDTAGSLLSVGAATNVSGAPAQPSAELTNIAVNPSQKLLVAATERHFGIQTTAMDSNIGRELIRLMPCPDIPPVEIPYVYGSSGGALAAEALGWVLSASNAWQNVTREIFEHDLTLDDSLAALLVERRLALILQERGTNWWTNLTLFPFRPSDAGRQFLPLDDLLAFQSRANGAPGYLIKPAWATLDGLVKAPPNGAVQALRDVTREIYRISSASNNAAPGVYQPPIDVLRLFLANGALDSNYAAVATLPAQSFLDASNGVAFLLASVTGRPVTNLNLRVRPDSFTGPCTVLETADLVMNLVRLFDDEGDPYAFPDAFQIPPGSVVQVTGYADAAGAACPGFGVEVISIGLEAVPVASDPDTDGNLLIDTWEKLFLALLGGDAFGDLDGDGYSNLQEMFDGSDPGDSQGIPPVPIASLAPPMVTIEIEEDGDIHLTWTWPAAYADKILFTVQSTPDLDTPLMPVPVMAVHLGGDNFEATIPNPGADGQFYVINLALR